MAYTTVSKLRLETTRMTIAIIFVIIFSPGLLLINATSVESNTMKYDSDGFQVNQTRCPLWFHYYSVSLQHCQCLPPSAFSIQCVGNDAFINSNIVMTHDRSKSLLSVQYSRDHQSAITNQTRPGPGLTRLPRNISELNKLMCGPLNRKGYLCSRCIDGFGPALRRWNSIAKCYNCTNHWPWQGVTLYVLVKLVPLTLFFFIVLIFQIRLTSAPMTCFIMYSQALLTAMHTLWNKDLLTQVMFTDKDRLRTPTKIIFVLYGIFNLDFIRYILPPFCISRYLTPWHLSFLGYVSICYPIILLFLTWFCITLHDNNVWPVVCMWKPFHRCFVQLRRSWNKRSDLLDVFATFLLLSYSKLMCQALTMTESALIFNFSLNELRAFHTYVLDADNSIKIDSLRYKLNACVTAVVFVLFNLLPMVLLAFYPISIFRKMLQKCKLDRAGLMIFMEKFHSCYKDGLDGGKDMRSISALYFLLRLIFSYGEELISFTLKLDAWFIRGMILSIAAIFIALCRPYKKLYMTISDALLLTHLSLLCFIFSSKVKSKHFIPFMQVMFLLPFSVFTLIVFLKLLRRFTRFNVMSVYNSCITQTPSGIINHRDSNNDVVGNQRRLIRQVKRYGARLCDHN